MPLLTLLLFFSLYNLEGWDNFADIEYEMRYIEKFGYEVEMPVFSDGILALEGKYLTLEGHYLPFDIDEKTIIISKLPFASCFFCGGNVGQETISEIQLLDKAGRLAPDDIVRVRGKLKLNDSDFDHFIFILEDAVILDTE